MSVRTTRTIGTDITERTLGQTWRLHDTLEDVRECHIQLEDMYGRHIVLCNIVEWSDYHAMAGGISYRPITLEE